MTVATCRFIAIILCLVLISMPFACAADCPTGCSCMLPSEAKQYEYSPCGGKLTLCGYDQYQTEKYCYITPAKTAAATGSAPPLKGALPYGWFTYRQQGLKDPISKEVFDAEMTWRYDISREMYHGNYAIHIRIDNQAISPTVPKVNARMDMYVDPQSKKILGGSTTFSQNGQTQTGNFDDVAKILSLGYTSYSQLNEALGLVSSTDIENAIRKEQSNRGWGTTLSKQTETVTVPAGTFPASTKYTLSQQGGSTTLYWYAPDFPVEVKEQGIDKNGKIEYSMELSGYKFTGDSASDELSPTSQWGISPLRINWDEVPAAMSGSITPALLGAIGALLGASIGLLSLFPAGFSWPGNNGGEGGDGGGGPDTGVPGDGSEPLTDDEAALIFQVAPGTTIAPLPPGNDPVATVDPVYRDRLRNWLKNQVYFAGTWYVSEDGRAVFTTFTLPDKPTPQNMEIPVDELLSDERFSTRVPSDLHQIMADQAAALIPVADLEKLRKDRWKDLSVSEREDILKRITPALGTPVSAGDIKLDVWTPGFVRPEGAPTEPPDTNYTALQYKIRHGPGDYESHVELNSAHPVWNEPRAIGAIIAIGHEVKHVQQGSVNDMEGYSPEDVRIRNVLVKQSYDTSYTPGADPSRYAANYVERDAESYGVNLVRAISKKIREPATHAAIKALDAARLAVRGGPPK